MGTISERRDAHRGRRVAAGHAKRHHRESGVVDGNTRAWLALRIKHVDRFGQNEFSICFRTACRQPFG